MKNPAELLYVYHDDLLKLTYSWLWDSHGPVFIGLLFNVLLYGIMIVQVYIYFTTYKRYAGSPQTDITRLLIEGLEIGDGSK